MDDVAIIILAAGKGTRMKSNLAKVLHPVAGKSMVNHVIEAAKGVSPHHIHVVVGHQADAVKKQISRSHRVCYAMQRELLGTGDAVKAAIPDLGDKVSSVVVLCGDVPLICAATIDKLVRTHISSNAHLTLLAVTVNEPKGYGRIILDSRGGLVAVREEADASDVEKTIQLVNSGIYCFNRNFLENGIKLIGTNNNQAEYYLTDLVEIAASQHAVTRVLAIDDSDQVMGVNTLEQLGHAEKLFMERQNELP
ncbi:MAG: NTP transferase domain-containing protein [Desulfobacter sp.]|nr:MAG: NTP transferase domain-containing protein [Desulfobacter sp.]